MKAPPCRALGVLTLLTQVGPASLIQPNRVTGFRIQSGMYGPLDGLLAQNMIQHHAQSRATTNLAYHGWGSKSRSSTSTG